MIKHSNCRPLEVLFHNKRGGKQLREGERGRQERGLSMVVMLDALFQKWPNMQIGLCKNEHPIYSEEITF